MRGKIIRRTDGRTEDISDLVRHRDKGKKVTVVGGYQEQQSIWPWRMEQYKTAPFDSSQREKERGRRGALSASQKCGERHAKRKVTRSAVIRTWPPPFFRVQNTRGVYFYSDRHAFFLLSVFIFILNILIDSFIYYFLFKRIVCSFINTIAYLFTCLKLII